MCLGYFLRIKHNTSPLRPSFIRTKRIFEKPCFFLIQTEVISTDDKKNRFSCFQLIVLGVTYWEFKTSCTTKTRTHITFWARPHLGKLNKNQNENLKDHDFFFSKPYWNLILVNFHEPIYEAQHFSCRGRKMANIFMSRPACLARLVRLVF